MLGTTNISAIGGGTTTGAISSLNTSLANNPSFHSDIHLDKVYGSTADTAINIDTLGGTTYHSYIYHVINGNYLTGTFPTGLNGNSCILIGFHGGTTEHMTHGCQMAIGFGSTKIARRYASYNADGSSWSNWFMIDRDDNSMIKYANPSLTENQLLTLNPGMYMYNTAFSWLPKGCGQYGTIVSYLTNSSGYGVIQIMDTSGNVYSRHHNSTGWHHNWVTIYKVPVHCLVQVNTGGDQTYTGAIVFNNVIQNVGNCYNASTGVFTCPVAGTYIVSFGYYSNNTSANSRPAIMLNGTMISMTNGPYGHDLSVTRYCAAGDKITAGAYNASYPVYMYAGGGHNHFSVTLIQAS